MDWGFYCGKLTGTGLLILLWTSNWNWTGFYCRHITGNGLDTLLWTANWDWPGHFTVDS